MNHENGTTNINELIKKIDEKFWKLLKKKVSKQN